MGTLDVSYYRKYDIPGRRYAIRPAGQWMDKSDRKVAFASPGPGTHVSLGLNDVDVRMNYSFMWLWVNSGGPSDTDHPIQNYWKVFNGRLTFQHFLDGHVKCNFICWRIRLGVSLSIHDFVEFS